MTDHKTKTAGFDKELELLQMLRDELKLKLHLAKADARDEYQQLEDKWERLQEDLRRSRSHVEQSAQSISHDARALLDELKASYEALKSSLLSGSKSH